MVQRPLKGPLQTQSRGTVKWFDIRRGYGFIIAEDPSLGDVFFHHTALVMDGFRAADEGEPVEFTLVEHRNGLRALNVRRV